MKNVRPLPPFLVSRYRRWREELSEEARERFARLAAEGQAPRAMIVACCDSRVMAEDVFGAEAGDFFIHRNIANLVPPFSPDGDHHGTSAAVEYAVTQLRVAHLVVIGHSSCGGVRGCMDMCEGHAPELQEKTSFIAARARALEQQGVVISLENLMSFPFVRERVEEGRLTLHGVWAEIGSGQLHCYSAAEEAFLPV